MKYYIRQCRRSGQTDCRETEFFMRIEKHPILSFDRSSKITFTYNGEEIEAYEGDTIAAALHAAGTEVKASLIYYPISGMLVEVE